VDGVEYGYKFAVSHHENAPVELLNLPQKIPSVQGEAD